MARMADEMVQPMTCAVGYNSIRFDDEFVRFGLYRNFHDAYEREWRDGNSRWDLLDVLRLSRRAAPGRPGMAAARGRRAQLQARTPGRRQRRARRRRPRGAERRARD